MFFSSEESAESSDDGGEAAGEVVMRGYAVLLPLVILAGHQGVVASADWMAGGEQVVTASWDRTATIWDVTSQTMIHSLGRSFGRWNKVELRQQGLI